MIALETRLESGRGSGPRSSGRLLRGQTRVLAEDAETETTVVVEPAAEETAGRVPAQDLQG